MTDDLLKQILDELRKQTPLLSAMANGMPLKKSGGRSPAKAKSPGSTEALTIPGDVEDVIILFGKHRGTKIADVDPDYLLYAIESFDNLRGSFGDALESIASANGLQTKGQKAHAANLKAGVPEPAFEQPAQNAAAANNRPPSDNFDDEIPF